MVASLLDARAQHGSARQLLLANAAVSAVAAVALGVAATGSVVDVLVIFGIWAAISGASQFATTLRRRAQFGNQWPMLAGGVLVIAGFAYVVAANGDKSCPRQQPTPDAVLARRRGSQRAKQTAP